MVDFPERRKENRTRVLKGGKVFYNHYAISIDCVIRDESEHGTRIRIDPAYPIPSDIAVLNRKDGTLADAKVIWKKGDMIGLEYSTKMEDVRAFSKSDIRRMSIIATRG